MIGVILSSDSFLFYLFENRITEPKLDKKNRYIQPSISAAGFTKPSPRGQDLAAVVGSTFGLVQGRIHVKDGT